MDLSYIRPTSLIAAGSMAAVFLGIVSTGSSENNNINTIRLLEAYILFIAFVQYLFVFFIPDERRSFRWRILDWFLTTPLLLGTYYLLAVEKGFDESIVPAIVANQIMILAGYWSEYPETSPFANYLTPDQNKYLWYVIGVVALVVILYYVRRWDQYIKSQGIDTEFLPYFFYIGWVLYGINFLVPDNTVRQTIFDGLDTFNKPIYTLYLTDFIDKNL